MTTRSAAMPRSPARGPSVAAGAGVLRVRRLGAKALRIVARHPGRVLGLVAVLGGVGVIGWNALMTQSGQHPAPLFASPRAAVAAPAEPPRRPNLTILMPAPGSRPEPASVAERPGPDGPQRTGSAPDPIGSMIRSPDPHPARTADARPSSGPRLVAAQKALTKLGYGPIGADGVMGSITRQALERFERDRGLSVTGALGPRTAKRLAAASGIQID